jgi:hypothetical protein
MRYLAVIVLILLFTAGYSGLVRVCRRRLRALRKTMDARNAYTIDAWCEEYYGTKSDHQKHCIGGILLRLEHELGVQVGKAIPSDPLDLLTELPFTERIFDDDVWGALEDLLPEYKVDVNWRTLDDLIESVLWQEGWKQTGGKKR